MRIGVDLSVLDPEYVGGVNTFAIGLVRGLIDTRDAADALILIVTRRNSPFLREKFFGSGVEFLEVPASRIGARVNTTLFDLSWVTGIFKLRYWYDRMFRPRLMRKIDRAIDVLVAPMTLLEFYGIRAPALLSIHDIQQEYHPEFFTWKQRVRRWAPYRLSSWRACAVQASSQYIKDCLLEKFSFMSPQKIIVIPEGVDTDVFSKTEGVKPENFADLEAGAFVFYPAQLWPHKNHLLLIEALARYRDRTGTELTCVLTGGDYGTWPAIEARAQSHGLRRIHYLGRVSFEQLLWIYRNCAAVLALGLHESSSLPVREGAVFGKALICLDIPPNREAASVLRITLVDPADTDDLVTAFLALRDNREGIMEVSCVNAQLALRFDWKNIAREYRRVMRSMAEA
jgi:glycosyltransferase involved in cell wall biosynthesis